MGKGKISQEEKKESLARLSEYRGKRLLAIINSVSRSGMTRRIEFYAPSNDGKSIDRIGYYMSKILEWPYNVDKGGFQVSGCGMDMIFHTLYCFNAAAWQFMEPEELKKWSAADSSSEDARTYHKRASGYFFPTYYTT